MKWLDKLRKKLGEYIMKKLNIDPEPWPVPHSPPPILKEEEGDE